MKFYAFITGAALAISGCANSGGANAPSSSAFPQPAYAPTPVTAVPASVRTTARGTFVGDGSHVASGTAEVFRDAQGYKIRLGPDFRLDGGPDPKVALGNGQGYVPGTILGRLSSFNGEQVYALKPGLDIGDYIQVYIWCEQFDVPLAHANLTLL